MPMKLEDAFRSPFDSRLPSSSLFNPKTVPRPELSDFKINSNQSNQSNQSNNNYLNDRTFNTDKYQNGNENENENENGNENGNGNEKSIKQRTTKTKESFKISMVEHNELVNNLMVYGTGGLIVLLMLELISKASK